MKVNQTVLQVDTVTVNNRYYPKEVVEKMVAAAKDKIDNRQLCLVQIDYNSGHEVDLTKVIGVATDARVDDTALIVNIEMLDVPLAKIVEVANVSFHTMIVATLVRKDNVYIVEDAELKYIFSHYEE